jgi:hypothetical protein
MAAPDYIDEDIARDAALRAIKAVVAVDAEEVPELTELLNMSAGSLTANGIEEDYFRPFYVAADYLFSDPDRIVKVKGGTTFSELLDVVATLLERQVRLDASSGAVIPDAWSAQTLLDRVLERSGRAPVRRRRAQLHVI